MATADTLALLEERIRRVDYMLNGDEQTAGDTEESTESKDSATARLRRIEHTLRQLIARSPAAAEVVALQKAHPSLFKPTSTSATATALPPPQLASLVLAHRHLYTTLNSHLTQLADSTIPDPAGAAKLVELRSPVKKVRAKQVVQERVMAELRGKSAGLVEKWYQLGVLGMGDRWAEWEDRMRRVEIAVRRREVAKKREEGIP